MGWLQHVANPAADALLGSRKKKDTSIMETVTDISDIHVISPLAEELGQIPHQSADNVPVC